VAEFAKESLSIQEKTSSAVMRGLAARKGVQLDGKIRLLKEKKNESHLQSLPMWDMFGMESGSEEEKEIEEEEEEVIVDIGLVTCDRCDKSIIGWRWRCVECPDYDLCHECHGEGNEDDGQHLKESHNLFLKIMQKESTEDNGAGDKRKREVEGE